MAASNYAEQSAKAMARLALLLGAALALAAGYLIALYLNYSPMFYLDVPSQEELPRVLSDLEKAELVNFVSTLIIHGEQTTQNFNAAVEAAYRIAAGLVGAMSVILFGVGNAFSKVYKSGARVEEMEI